MLWYEEDIIRGYCIWVYLYFWASNGIGASRTCYLCQLFLFWVSRLKPILWISGLTQSTHALTPSDGSKSDTHDHYNNVTVLKFSPWLIRGNDLVVIVSWSTQPQKLTGCMWTGCDEWGLRSEINSEQVSLKKNSFHKDSLFLFRLCWECGIGQLTHYVRFRLGRQLNSEELTAPNLNGPSAGESPRFLHLCHGPLPSLEGWDQPLSAPWRLPTVFPNNVTVCFLWELPLRESAARWAPVVWFQKRNLTLRALLPKYSCTQPSCIAFLVCSWFHHLPCF